MDRYTWTKHSSDEDGAEWWVRDTQFPESKAMCTCYNETTANQVVRALNLLEHAHRALSSLAVTK